MTLIIPAGTGLSEATQQREMAISFPLGEQREFVSPFLPQSKPSSRRASRRQRFPKSPAKERNEKGNGNDIGPEKGDITLIPAIRATIFLRVSGTPPQHDLVVAVQIVDPATVQIDSVITYIGIVTTTPANVSASSCLTAPVIPSKLTSPQNSSPPLSPSALDNPSDTPPPWPSDQGQSFADPEDRSRKKPPAVFTGAGTAVDSTLRARVFASGGKSGRFRQEGDGDGFGNSSSSGNSRSRELEFRAEEFNSPVAARVGGDVPGLGIGFGIGGDLAASTAGLIYDSTPPFFRRVANYLEGLGTWAEGYLEREAQRVGKNLEASRARKKELELEKESKKKPVLVADVVNANANVNPRMKSAEAVSSFLPTMPYCPRRTPLEIDPDLDGYIFATARKDPFHSRDGSIPKPIVFEYCTGRLVSVVWEKENRWDGRRRSAQVWECDAPNGKKNSGNSSSTGLSPSTWGGKIKLKIILNWERFSRLDDLDLVIAARANALSVWESVLSFIIGEEEPEPEGDPELGFGHDLAVGVVNGWIWIAWALTAFLTAGLAVILFLDRFVDLVDIGVAGIGRAAVTVLYVAVRIIVIPFKVVQFLWGIPRHLYTLLLIIMTEKIPALLKGGLDCLMQRAVPIFLALTADVITWICDLRLMAEAWPGTILLMGIRVLQDLTMVLFCSVRFLWLTATGSLMMIAYILDIIIKTIGLAAAATVAVLWLAYSVCAFAHFINYHHRRWCRRSGLRYTQVVPVATIDRSVIRWITIFIRQMMLVIQTCGSQGGIILRSEFSPVAGNFSSSERFLRAINRVLRDRAAFSRSVELTWYSVNRLRLRYKSSLLLTVRRTPLMIEYKTLMGVHCYDESLIQRVARRFFFGTNSTLLARAGVRTSPPPTTVTNIPYGPARPVVPTRRPILMIEYHIIMGIPYNGEALTRGAARRFCHWVMSSLSEARARQRDISSPPFVEHINVDSPADTGLVLCPTVTLESSPQPVRRGSESRLLEALRGREPPPSYDSLNSYGIDLDPDSKGRYSHLEFVMDLDQAYGYQDWSGVGFAKKLEGKVRTRLPQHRFKRRSLVLPRPVRSRSPSPIRACCSMSSLVGSRIQQSEAGTLTEDLPSVQLTTQLRRGLGSSSSLRSAARRARGRIGLTMSVSVSGSESDGSSIDLQDQTDPFNRLIRLSVESLVSSRDGYRKVQSLAAEASDWEDKPERMHGVPRVEVVEQAEAAPTVRVEVAPEGIKTISRISSPSTLVRGSAISSATERTLVDQVIPGLPAPINRGTLLAARPGQTLTILRSSPTQSATAASARLLSAQRSRIPVRETPVNAVTTVKVIAPEAPLSLFPPTAADTPKVTAIAKPPPAPPLPPAAQPQRATVRPSSFLRDDRSWIAIEGIKKEEQKEKKGLLQRVKMGMGKKSGNGEKEKKAGFFARLKNKSRGENTLARSVEVLHSINDAQKGKMGAPSALQQRFGEDYKEVLAVLPHLGKKKGLGSLNVSLEGSAAERVSADLDRWQAAVNEESAGGEGVEGGQVEFVLGIRLCEQILIAAKAAQKGKFGLVKKF